MSQAYLATTAKMDRKVNRVDLGLKDQRARKVIVAFLAIRVCREWTVSRGRQVKTAIVDCQA